MKTPTILLLLLTLPLSACKSGKSGEADKTAAAGAEAQTGEPQSGKAETPAAAEAAKAAAAKASSEAVQPKPNAIPAPPDVAAPPADAEKTDSGLCSKVLKQGTGTEHPGPTDRVRVNYTGWTTDGKMFDSSVARGQPAEFPLNRVIPGWTEGLQLMVVGETRRLWIPEALAYKGMPGRPAGMLVFDVSLLDIKKMPAPPPVPKDVAAPPKKAKKTASGLAYEYLKHGQGKAHPKAESLVEVNYTGWTTDGKMFDSSITRGQPAVFPLNRVIPGWTEMVQLMVPGDEVRVWIPETLAYKGRPGAPQGTLVFDIQLLSIKR